MGQCLDHMKAQDPASQSGCLPLLSLFMPPGPNVLLHSPARARASSQFGPRIFPALQAILKSCLLQEAPPLPPWPGLATCGHILVPTAPFWVLQRSGRIWVQHASPAFLPPWPSWGVHDCEKSICSTTPVASFDIFHHSERQDALGHVPWPGLAPALGLES